MHDVPMTLLLTVFDLFEIAIKAHGQIPASAGDRQKVGPEPIVAVVFSAMALDGFINEVGACAAFAITHYDEPPAVAALATVLAETESAHGSTEAKYMLAHLALTGQAYSRGTQPYQDFAVLVDARNALVHHKPERLVMRAGDADLVLQEAAVRRKLRDRQLLWEGDQVHGLTALTDVMRTRAVARWALDTAWAMMQSIHEIIPDSECRKLIARENLPRPPIDRKAKGMP
jgi:hypothetical protein